MKSAPVSTATAEVSAEGAALCYRTVFVEGAVVLGCTEIPLLIGDADSLLPTLDSTRILARAALRAATAA